MTAVIGWDRLREPRRDPARPFAVVDHRTYRDGQRRLSRLAGDTQHALYVIEAMRQWLRGEIHTGPKRRRPWCAAQLEQLELTRARLTGDA
jgi:hypothetical protein